MRRRPAMMASRSARNIGALHLPYGKAHQEARWLREGGEWETIAVCDEDMYHREIASFAACILEDRQSMA
jgi:hypothetical protein